MEQSKEKNSQVQLEFLERTLPLELTAEFTLPDYHSEISRLLWVRPTILPPQRFIGGGKADFSGACRFQVLYVGPDGALYGAEPESGYSFSVPLEAPAELDVAAGIALSAMPVADAVISRVTGPRKLSVRCKMHARVQGYAQRDLSLKMKGEMADPNAVCRLCSSLEGNVFHGAGNESVHLTDRLEEDSEVRVIDTHGSVFFSEVGAGHDEVHCRGEVLLTLLVCSEGEQSGIPYTVHRRLPFSQSVVLEGVQPDCRANVTGNVGEICAKVEEGHLEIEAQLHLCAQAQGAQPILFARDAFLPGYDAEYRYTEAIVPTSGICQNRHFSISGELLFSELGLSPEAEVIDVAAEAEIREKTADGAKILLSGELCCHLLCLQNGEYVTQEGKLPLRILLEDGSEDMCVSCSVCQCRTVKGSDSVRVDGEVMLALRSTRPQNVRALTEISFTPKSAQENSTFPEIYYPTEGQTLWDVAKQYGIAPDTLADANALEAEDPANPASLQGKRFLLIP